MTRQAARDAQAHAVAMIAQRLALGGEHDKALSLIAAQPHHPALAAARAVARSEGIARWHFPMLADARRNTAFDAAIREMVQPDTHVLDIGTGSGLLAMMAARAGAARVTAVEADARLADTARTVIAANGFADRITVIAAPSATLTAADIGGRADLLICEIFGDLMLQENALATIRHARAELLVPEARIVPARGRVYAALARYDRKVPMLDDVAGFDLSAFARHAPPWRHPEAMDTHLSLCGPAATLFDLDFTSDLPARIDSASATLALDSASAHGIACWFELDLAPGLSTGNRPGAGASHWSVRYTGFDAPRTGDVAVGAAHDGVHILVWPE